MLRRARRSRNQIQFVSPTEEIDKINKIRIERELKEAENKELVVGLNENRKSLFKLESSFKEIEKEHENKIEKSKNEYLSILKEIDLKSSELRAINEKIFSLLNIENDLLNSIPSLEKRKNKLEDEIKRKTEDYNKDKNNSEIYLTFLSKEISENDKKLKELKNNLNNTQIDFDKLIKKINNENEVLSKRQRDLEIHEVRLKKKYPEVKIIL